MNDIQSEVDWVIERLKAYANDVNDIDAETEGKMRDDAKRLISEEGWLPGEVYLMMRVMEHVSPTIPEKVALNIMARVEEQVKKRKEKV